MYALALQATILVRIKHVEYLSHGVFFTTKLEFFEIGRVLPEGFQVRDINMAQDDSLMDIKAGVITPETQERFVDLKNKGTTLKDGDDDDSSGHPRWRTILSAVESTLGPDHVHRSHFDHLKRKRPYAAEYDHDPDEVEGEHKSVDDVDNGSELESTNVAEDAAEALVMDIDWRYIASDGQPGCIHWDDNIGYGVEQGISDGSRSNGSEDGEELVASVKRDVSELPTIPKKLGQTCTEMVWAVAKDIDNLWTGATYIKLYGFIWHQGENEPIMNFVEPRRSRRQMRRDLPIRGTLLDTNLALQDDSPFDDLDRALDLMDASKLERKVKTVLGLIAEHNLHKPAPVERVADLDPLDARIAEARLDKIGMGPDNTDTTSETHDDDEDSDDKEFQDDEIDPASGKEPSRPHLKVLQTLTRRILQDPDPDLDTAVTAQTICERAYGKSKFSKMEYERPPRS
ncbi:hypothetical protein EC957_006432 [Mortierella hygrophila]|uniref:Uncharacterized protein n=1 Tax=Mortierella hygrophila TaxID=979708 RepID=A0A9P6EZ18_9FUNG|nr:hypothetical protein EC957_006432 [Mortierella hygrophila]